MAENKAGCARPTGANAGGEEQQQNSTEKVEVKEKVMQIAKVGAKAPDFTAPAYYRGELGSVKLSQFLGKWIVLCFYPGDFTFV